ncbi:MAG: hypothetical protein ACFFD2_13840 [Promethearchaeota archaeon]
MIKFDGEEIIRCYAVSFDYDEWNYMINENDVFDLPRDVKKITIEIEH